MKKIYSLLVLTGCAAAAFGQNASVVSPFEKQAYAPKSHKPTHQATTMSGGAISGRFDMGYSLITFNGVQPSDISSGSGGAKVGIYVQPSFCDSTTQSSFSSGNSYISTMKFGSTFDPRSPIYDQVTYNPLFAPTDAYYLDTVWVGCFYKRKTADIDTLQVEIVWGDTTATSVFGRWSYASPYAYYGTFVTPKYATSNTQQGNTARLTAPAANRIVIKKPLTDADTTFLQTTDYFPIPVNGAMGQLIPANNIVSVNGTYIPGQASYSVGTVSYSGSGTSPQTMNGFAAIVYDQNSPSQPVAGSDYFDDYGKGKNYSQFLSKRQRYGTETPSTSIFTNTMRASIASSYWIDFSIHGTSTVGINELEKNGFELGQNMPNPYSNQSTVRYQLAKDAKSVTFKVTDMMGRVLSESNEPASSGVHAVNLGAYSAGVYYYSLTVDGRATTKKMIVQ